MASLLDSFIKQQVAAGFKGQLRKGTLRRDSPATVDEAGDPVPGTPTDYTFDGIRENIDAAYAARASIPVTDVRILIILGSLPDGVDPKQEDLVQIPKGTGPWHKIRRIMAVDPAGASGQYQCYEIEAP